MQVGAADPYISDPGRVNRIIDDVDTPKIEPGESDEMVFNLHNPYDEVIQDVRLNVSIYLYAHLGEEKNISEVENHPIFSAGGEVEKRLGFEALGSQEEEDIELKISSDEDTEEGVYLLRFWLEFDYEEEAHVMKSMGYFSEEELVEAGASNNESYEDTGGLDLEILGISGLLADSSFSVKKSLPRWPQYLLGILSVLFGVLAVVFYFHERYDLFPGLEKTFEDWTRKFEEFGRRLEKRSDKP